MVMVWWTYEVGNLLYGTGPYIHGVVNVAAGSCPRCRVELEVDATFCHACGLDLSGPQAMGVPMAPSPAPYQPGFAPYPMFPAPGVEVPPNPLGHRRALAGMAGIMILFNASIILIFGLIYLIDETTGWESVGNGWDPGEQRVIYWEWVLVGIFMLASFGTGIAGGIMSIRATRFPLAMVSAIMLLVCAVIIHWETWSGGGSSGIWVFILMLAILPIVFLVMAITVFTSKVIKFGKGKVPHATDNYGWASTHGAPPPGAGEMPRGMGP
jgi:hypothetical protein